MSTDPKFVILNPQRYPECEKVKTASWGNNWLNITVGQTHCIVKIRWKELGQHFFRFYPDSEKIQSKNHFQVEYARDWALPWTMGWWHPSCLYHCRAGAEPSGGYFEPNMQKMNGYWSSGPTYVVLPRVMLEKPRRWLQQQLRPGLTVSNCKSPASRCKINRSI